MTANIVLKSIHNAIVNDNPNSTLTTKQMRAKLRAISKFDHVRNASWLFNANDADDCRALFDPVFAAKLDARRKRAAKPAKPKRQRAAKPAPVEADASTDA
jgi:predicted phosphoadenosine phosphosulfate sulfurtransferase